MFIHVHVCVKEGIKRRIVSVDCVESVLSCGNCDSQTVCVCLCAHMASWVCV